MTKRPRHGEKRIKRYKTHQLREKRRAWGIRYFSSGIYIINVAEWNFKFAVSDSECEEGVLGKTVAWLSTLCGLQLREKMLPAWATSLKSDSYTLEKYLLNTCVLGPGLSPEDRRLGETASALPPWCWESSGGLRLQKERTGLWVVHALKEITWAKR